MDIKTIIAIASFVLEVLTIGIAIGVYKNKQTESEARIKDMEKQRKDDLDDINSQISKLEEKHEKDMMKVEQKMNNTDELLLAIKDQLTSLNTKVDLIIQDKIKIGDKN